MNIVVLKHNEIDAEKWNNLLEQSKGAKIFSSYEYLNAVHPKWKAIIQIDNGEYQFALPLPEKSYYGIKYLVQPMMVSDFQLLKREGLEDLEFVRETASKLCSYLSIRYCLDIDFSRKLFEHKDIPWVERQNAVLELKKNYDYTEGFSKSHTRNIRRFQKEKVEILVNQDFEELMDEFIEVNRQKFPIGSKFTENFQRLIPFFKSREDAKVVSLYKGSERIASSLFTGFAGRCIFLLSYSNEKSRNISGTHGIIDYWLKNMSEAYDVLDFEGGNLSSLARFYYGFGARPEPYFYLQNHDFPFNIVFKKSDL